MVSTMTWMAVGFAGLCLGLSLNFYRKYRSRLYVGGPILQYSRIADYHGVPLPLAFEYRSEDDHRYWIEVDVEEIYHYGQDYFLRGFGVPDRKGNIYKWNRVAHLKIRSNGRTLDSVAALLGVAGKEVGAAARV